MKVYVFHYDGFISGVFTDYQLAANAKAKKKRRHLRYCREHYVKPWNPHSSISTRELDKGETFT